MPPSRVSFPPPPPAPPLAPSFSSSPSPNPRSLPSSKQQHPPSLPLTSSELSSLKSSKIRSLRLQRLLAVRAQASSHSRQQTTLYQGLRSALRSTAVEAAFAEHRLKDEEEAERKRDEMKVALLRVGRGHEEAKKLRDEEGEREMLRREDDMRAKRVLMMRSVRAAEASRNSEEKLNAEREREETERLLERREKELSRGREEVRRRAELRLALLEVEAAARSGSGAPGSDADLDSVAWDVGGLRDTTGERLCDATRTTVWAEGRRHRRNEQDVERGWSGADGQLARVNAEKENSRVGEENKRKEEERKAFEELRLRRGKAALSKANKAKSAGGIEKALEHLEQREKKQRDGHPGGLARVNFTLLAKEKEREERRKARGMSDSDRASRFFEKQFLLQQPGDGEENPDAAESKKRVAPIATHVYEQAIRRTTDTYSKERSEAILRAAMRNAEEGGEDGDGNGRAGRRGRRERGVAAYAAWDLPKDGGADGGGDGGGRRDDGGAFSSLPPKRVARVVQTWLPHSDMPSPSRRVEQEGEYDEMKDGSDASASNRNVRLGGSGGRKEGGGGELGGFDDDDDDDDDDYDVDGGGEEWGGGDADGDSDDEGGDGSRKPARGGVGGSPRGGGRSNPYVTRDERREGQPPSLLDDAAIEAKAVERMRADDRERNQRYEADFFRGGDSKSDYEGARFGDPSRFVDPFDGARFGESKSDFYFRGDLALGSRGGSPAKKPFYNSGGNTNVDDDDDVDDAKARSGEWRLGGESLPPQASADNFERQIRSMQNSADHMIRELGSQLESEQAKVSSAGKYRSRQSGAAPSIAWGAETSRLMHTPFTSTPSHITGFSPSVSRSGMTNTPSATDYSSEDRTFVTARRDMTLNQTDSTGDSGTVRTFQTSSEEENSAGDRDESNDFMNFYESRGKAGAGAGRDLGGLSSASNSSPPSADSSPGASTNESEGRSSAAGSSSLDAAEALLRDLDLSKRSTKAGDKSEAHFVYSPSELQFLERSETEAGGGGIAYDEFYDDRFDLTDAAVAELRNFDGDDVGGAEDADLNNLSSEYSNTSLDKSGSKSGSPGKKSKGGGDADLSSSSGGSKQSFASSSGSNKSNLEIETAKLEGMVRRLNERRIPFDPKLDLLKEQRRKTRELSEATDRSYNSLLSASDNSGSGGDESREVYGASASQAPKDSPEEPTLPGDRKLAGGDGEEEEENVLQLSMHTLNESTESLVGGVLVGGLLPSTPSATRAAMATLVSTPDVAIGAEVARGGGATAVDEVSKVDDITTYQQRREEDGTFLSGASLRSQALEEDDGTVASLASNTLGGDEEEDESKN